MAMGYALQAAIQRADSIDPGAVSAAFPTILMDSFYGQLGFDGFGQNSAKSVGTAQIDITSTLQLISPLSSSTASMVYPMPSWEERTFTPQPFHTPAEIVITIFAALGIVFSCVMGALTFRYRDNKAIVASSPLFLYIMLFGSVVLYTSIFTWNLTTSDALCMIHWWLLGCGFCFMYLGLLVKAWRISRIFNKSHLAVIRISNQDLLIIVGGGLLIEVILLVVWTAVGPSKSITLPTDPLRPSLDYMTCTSSKTGEIILILAGIYKLGLIIVGVALSIQTWRIKLKIYNESRSIAFSMYNLFFFLVLAIIVQLVINTGSQRVAQYVVRSAVIILGTAVPIAVIFIPKFTSAIYLDSDNIGGSSSASGKRTTTSSVDGAGGLQSSSYKSNYSKDYSRSKGSHRSKDYTVTGNGTDEEVELIQLPAKRFNRMKQQNERLKTEVKELREKVHALEGGEV